MKWGGGGREGWRKRMGMEEEKEGKDERRREGNPLHDDTIVW